MPYLTQVNHPDEEWQGSLSSKPNNKTPNILIPVEVESNIITGFVVLDDSFFPEEGQITLFDYAGSNYKESFASLTIHCELNNPTLEDGYILTLLKLAHSIDHCNLLSQNHAIKTAFWAIKIAQRLGFTQEQLNQIELASKLHDIGKVVVPKSVLTKPSKLSNHEWMIIRRHPTYGALIMKPSSRLHTLIPFVEAHHENFDGSGYPLGLAGEQIPLQARIISVADAYTTITEGRVYLPASTELEALREIERCSGKQFDPKIILLLKEIINSGEFDDTQCIWGSIKV